MKKIYLVGLAFALFTSACDDVLEKTSSTQLPTEEAITSIEDLTNAVNGVYMDQATEVGSYAAEFGIYADLRGGDFESVSTNNHAGMIYRYQTGPNDSMSKDFYTVFYTCLARLNSVLSVAGNIEGSEALQGELYALRALYHFDLARLFAQLPTTTDMSGLGIVLSTEVYPTTYIGTRATLQQTYDQILSDLNTALGLLSKDQQTGRINYWAALGIRARAYLYLGQNENALADCKEIIANSPYRLYTRDEYPTVWLQEGSVESMFEILTTQNYNAQRNSIGYFTHASGYGECAATEAFVEELAKHPDDIRTTLFAEETDNGYNGVYPQKYNGRDGQIYVNNPKIIRLSEVYLIAAEAALKSGDATAAAGYINDLRQNRIENYTDVTSVTIDDILLERRLELYAEGHAAFDAWRNGRSVNNTFVGEVPSGDNRTVCAIPISEINVAHGELQQNPGY